MQNAKQKGFTLIELLLVITIISILAGIIMPSFFGKSNDARNAAAKQMIAGTFSMALDMYEQDYGRYPDTLDQLVGKYINIPSVPPDPWGNEYKYAPNSSSDSGSASGSGPMYEIVSAGSDGNFGTQDDISNYNIYQIQN